MITLQYIIILFLLLILLGLQNNEFFESTFWNSTRRTKNMSYDLRGDPIIIPQQKYIWNNIDRPYTILARCEYHYDKYL
jgi:hypothetical protein